MKKLLDLLQDELSKTDQKLKVVREEKPYQIIQTRKGKFKNYIKKNDVSSSRILTGMSMAH